MNYLHEVDDPEYEKYCQEEWQWEILRKQHDSPKYYTFTHEGECVDCNKTQALNAYERCDGCQYNLEEEVRSAERAAGWWDK